MLTFLLLSIYVPIANAADIAPPAPNQLPTGGQVKAGNAQIDQVGAAMTINQSSDRAVIDWMRFDVGRDASVRIDQPSAESVILNRVQDSNPSQIFGKLESNGQVFLTNPNGVVFGPGASVDVGGLVATTGEIGTDDFMAGNAIFDLKNSKGSVINKGNLSAKAEGYIALLAPEVRNEGVIIAQAGTVALVAGDVITLNFERSSHLASISVTPSSIATLVENKHAILAPGGQIILSARATEELIGSVVQSGELSASSLVNRGGRIMLEGDEINLGEDSSIIATGTTGGGEVLVGGDWQGTGDMHQATTVTMEQGATIDASATDNGDGGKVVLWSDVTKENSLTVVHGEITARGGVNGGDGGQIETSGYSLNTTDISVNAGATDGKGGLWLLDPADSAIDQTVANTYAATLNTGTSVLNEVTGDITLNSGVSIAKTAGGDATLTFKATDKINLLTGSSITSSSNKLNVIIWVESDGGTSVGASLGSISTNGGNVWVGGGSGTNIWNGLSVGNGLSQSDGAANWNAIDVNADITTSGGDIYLAADDGNSANPSIGANGASHTLNAGSGDISLIVRDASSFLYGANSLILDTTGTVSIAPPSTENFVSDITWNAGISGLSVTNMGALNLGTYTGTDVSGDTAYASANTRNMTIASAINVAGPINIYGGDIYLNNNLSTTSATKDINLLASNNIAQTSASAITTNGGNVLLASNTDASSGGQIDLRNGLTINSNGGDIILGGGDATGSGYAEGYSASQTEGIRLSGVTTLNSSGGDITLRGKSFAGAVGSVEAFGVGFWDNPISINSGTGNILIDGIGRSSGSGAFAYGVASNSDVTIQSASTSSNAIKITGNADASTNGWNFGIQFFGANSKLYATGVGGGITLDADGGSVGSDFEFSRNVEILAASGPIQLLSHGGTLSVGQAAAGSLDIGSKAGTAITASSSDITIAADTYSFASIPNINTSGDFTWKSVANSFAQNVNTNFFNYNTSGGQTLTNLTIGSSTNTAGITVNNAFTTTGDIKLYGGNIDLASSLTSTGSGADILLKASGHIIGNGSDITTNGGDITLQANATDANANAYIYLQDNTTLDSRTNTDRIAANIATASGGGNIILGGGSNLVTGYALSNSSALEERAGIELGTDDSAGSNSNIAFYSGGGDITLRGESTAASSWGIQVYEGLNIDAGTTGDISLNGKSNGYHGIEFASFRAGSAPTLLRTTNGDITLSGINTSVGGFTAVQLFADDSTNAVTLAATGTGTININATSTANFQEFDFRHVNILAAQGDISITGSSARTLYAENFYLGSKVGSLVTSSTSNILIEADQYNFSTLPFINTSGDFIWSSASSSFGQTVSSNWWNYNTTGGQVLNNISIGKTSNTSDVLLNSEMTFAGNYKAYGSDITQSASLTSTGAGEGILLKATNNIVLQTSADISTNNGGITFWSDSDASGLGYIALGATSDLTSSGGDITLSGGAALATGYARANGATAISIGNSNTINSDGGDILLRGWADLNGAGIFYGVDLHTGVNINSGLGSIGIYAKSDDFYALQVSNGSAAGVTIESAKTSGTAITLDGRSTVDYGVVLNFDVNKQILATGGGDISILGVAGGNYGLFLSDIDILATSGTITLDGGVRGIVGGGSKPGAIIGYKAGSAVTSSSSDINIIGDDVGFGSYSSINTTGALDIHSSSNSFSSAFDTSVLTLGSTLSDLTIGKSTNTAEITVGSAISTINDVTINGGRSNIDASITSTGGDISISGTTLTDTRGIWFSNGADITTAGAGSITLVGDTQNSSNTSGASIYGVSFSDGTVLTTDSGDISVTGTGSKIAGNSRGIVVETNNVEIRSASGDITLTDVNPVVTTGAYSGLYLANGVKIGKGSLASSSSDVIIEADNLTLSSAIDTTGSLTVQSNTNSFTTGFNTNTLTLGSTLGGLTIGKSTNTANITLGQAHSIAGDINIYGGTIAVDNALTSTGSNTITLTSNTATTQTAAVTADKLLLNGSGAYTLNNASNNIATLATNSGAVSYVDSNAFTVGTVAATNGATSTGAINLATQTGDMTLSQAISTTDTSSSAVILNAGKAAAGTSIGGNLLVGSTISTGAGGRATLYSGSVSGSTGLTALVGSGSGNFRYNSDESTTNYSLALGAGDYAVYREAPTLTIDADDKTVTYGTAPTLTTTIGSAQNGDAAGQALSSSSVSVGGSTSTSGNYTAGVHALTASAVDQLGYALSYVSGALTVLQKALSLSGITAANKIYDGNTTAATNIGSAVFSGLISGDDLSLSAVSGLFDNKNAGTGKTVTLSSSYAGADLANYSVTDQASVTANITAKSLTVSGITAANKVYDQDNTAVVDGSGVAFGGLVSGDTISLSSTSGVFGDKNVAAGKTVTLTNAYGGTDLNNYSIVDQASTTADITAKALTVSGITASNKTYDGNTTATVDGSGISFSGLISGDTLSLSSTSGAFGDKNVGVGKTVTLTNSFGGADLNNYSITDQASTTANITSKALTVSGITASNKTYDGNTTATVDGSGIGFAGLVSGDVVSLSSTSGAFNDKNVGTGKTVTLTNNFGGADLGNYSITDQASTTANITQKALTISGITAANKVYDRTTTATVDGSGVGFAGLVSGDTVSLSSTSGVFGDKNVGTGKTVTLTNNFGGADLANYSITDQASTTANITAKGITVSGITAANKTYDGNTTATVDGSGVTFGGLISGDNVLLSAISGLFSDKNVATGKTVTLSSSYGGTDAGNYSITDQASTTANITAKGVTVSGITAANKTYDGNTTATVDGSGVTFGGLISGDNVLLSAISGLFSDKNVATGKTVTLSSSYGGTDAANYSITDQASTTANITQKALTISGITVANKVYDRTTTATVDGSGVGFSGLVSGDTVSLSSTSGAFNDKNVGAGKIVTLTNNFGGADLANYSITDQASTTANITAKGITFSGITASNKTYDGNTTATVDGSNVTFVGLVSGDTVSLSSTSGAFNDKNVGLGKTVTLTNNFGGADLANYSITDQASTTANITQKALTISGITAANKVYDRTTTATVDGSGVGFSGLVSGDTVSLSSTSGAFNDKNVGSGKTVTLTNVFGGTDVNNYSITDQASTIANITQKALSISGITAANKAYDGNTTATVDGNGVTFGGLISGDTLSLSSTSGAFNVKNAGTGKTVTLTNNFGGADLGNYSIIDQASTTANITAKGITVSGIAAANKTYDGTTTATVDGSGIGFAGLVSGDVVSLLSTSGAFNDKNVGAGKAVVLTNAFGGTDVNNYSITDQASTTANITQKALVISGITAANKAYDGNTTATVDGSGIGFAGLVSGDVVSLSSTSGAFNDKNVGVGKTVTLTNSFGGTDIGNYSVTDQVSTTADITARGITVSGITVSNKTYDGNATATVDGAGVSFSGLISGDILSLVSTSGVFSDKNAGSGKTVTLTNAFAGLDLNNYSFTDQVSTTANIATKAITVSGITASDKTYDGNTTATVDGSSVSFNGLISGDSLLLSAISGLFSDKNVATGKIVTLSSSYGGSDAANYSITDQASTTADISAKGITVSGITAANKTYDGNITVTVDGSGVTFGGLVSGDNLLLSAISGLFSDKNTGTGKTVALNSSYGGTDVNNYTITDQASTAANITSKALAISGITASNKTYDGNATATVDGNSVAFGGLVSGDIISLSTTSGAFNNKNVGASKTVTLTNIFEGTDVNNYSITDQASTTATITQKALSISGITASNKTYDGNTTATVDGSGIGFAGLVSGDVVSLSSTSGAFNDKNVGTGKTVTLTNIFGGTDVNNYSITDQASTTANIIAKALIISGITALNKTYDSNTTATVDGSGIGFAGLVSGDLVSLSSTSGAFNDKNVGAGKTVTLTNSFGGSDIGNYSVIDQTTTTAGITAKGISISGITASNKTYDGNTTASADGSGVGFAGLVSGDTISLTSTNGVFNDKNVGTDKTVTLTNTFGGVDVNNYTITDQASTTANITQKALAISGITAANKTYDGNTIATVDGSGIGLAGLVSGDVVSLSSVSGAFNDKNIGTGKTVTLANVFGGTDVNNYNIIDQASTAANIIAKGVTVSGITASNKTYDGNIAAIVDGTNVAFAGLVSGDTISLSTTSGAFNDKNVGVGKTVTLTNVFAGADVNNYTIVDQASTTADITAKAITISGITAANKTYDGITTATIDDSDVSFTGLVSGDTLSLATSSGAFNDKNVGTNKTITLTNIFGGADLNNYSITDQVSTNADITTRGITIAGITAANKIYDGNTSAVADGSGVTFAGLVSGDTVSLTSTNGVFGDKHVATGKAVTLINILGGADVNNYSIVDQASTTADISAKAITVSGITASSKTYDGNSTATVDGSGVAFGGLISGDNLLLSAVSGLFSDKNAGTGKTVALNSAYGGTDVGNYTFTDQVSTTADITTKAITVSALTAENKIYDGTTAAIINIANVVFGGIVSGDILSVISSGNFADKNVGTGKTVNINSTYGGADLANYTITDQVSTVADVLTKQLTINLNGEGSKVYDGTGSIDLGGITSSLSGIVTGDLVAINGGSVTGFVDKNVGTNKAVLFSGFGISGVDSANYVLGSNNTPSSASITPRLVSVTGIAANDKTYDGTTAATVDDSNVVFDNLIFGDDLLLTTVSGQFADRNADIGKNVLLSSTYGGADFGNYIITDQALTTADINRASLIIRAQFNSKIYDGNTSAEALPEVIGLIAGDGISGVSESYLDAGAGTGKTVAVNDDFLINDGNSGSNYAVTLESNTESEIIGETVEETPAENRLIPFESFRFRAFTSSGERVTSNSGLGCESTSSFCE